MVDLTNEADADWMARGRAEASDEELAQLHGEVIACEGRRFIVVPGAVPDERPLPDDTQAQIFDAREGTLHDPQPLGSILAHCPHFEPVDDGEDDQS